MEENVQSALADAAAGGILVSIETKIFTIRGKQVMLDRDLALLYGVETKHLNRQVSRNIGRFPEDFMFLLSLEEFSTLKCKIGTSSWGGDRRIPHAFTEQGIAMLSGVLKSQRAIETNITIMRAFVSMRHYLSSNSGILQRIESLESWKLKTTEQVDAILDRMQALEPKEKNEQLFQNGCVFDAWSYVSALIREAKQEIILIDNYVDETVLAILAKRADGVKAAIHSRYTDKFKTDLEKFNKQYPNNAVTFVQLSQHNHDRFLIIDDNVYLLGASLKDLGNTWGAMIKMNETGKEDILRSL